MRRKFVAGNWKMNGSSSQNNKLVSEILAEIGGISRAEIALCPPFVYLMEVGRQIAQSGIALGAQNCAVESPGAFTGEIAATMLIDLGCRYVIIGHSERRALYGESDVLVAAKFATARTAGLIPILCVGERLEEREAGITGEIVARQIDAILDSQGITVFANSVIAYEPVWAIGTGRTATPSQAQEVHAIIRTRLAEHNTEIATQTRILYGGSVKGNNAAELFAMPDIDGGLIGGASLNAQEFMAICAAADRN